MSLLTIKHWIQLADRNDRRKQMKNFEKHFNEDFDLQEAVEFKDDEKRKEFNRSWVTKFKDILLTDSLCHYDKATPAGGGWIRSYRPYKVEKVFVGAKTGKLIAQTIDKRGATIKFSIDALRNSFGPNGTKKEHWELYKIKSTEKLLALLNEYNAEYDLAAKGANYVNRAEQHAEEKLEDQVNTGRTIAENGKTDNIVDWVKDHITNLVFKLPTTNRAPDAPKSLGARLAKIQAGLERRYPGITKSKHFELEDKPSEKEIPYYSFWGLVALTTFDEPYENFPEELVQMVKDAKDISRQRGKKDNQVTDAKPTDKTINNIYFAFAILDLLDDDYTLCDKSPVNVANSDDVFKQDFDSVNAYGEKVETESLKEAKEEICCICGEPIEGYGNNPRPYKHEGRCCDACQRKFVLPARLAKLNNRKE